MVIYDIIPPPVCPIAQLGAPFPLLRSGTPRN